MSDTLDARTGTRAVPAAEPPAKHGPDWVKWSLGCAGVGMLLFTGTIMLILIVLPVGFRSLAPEDQERVIKHAPFMRSFMPTRAYAFDTLPTVQASKDGSQLLALLASPSVTSTLITPTATKTVIAFTPVLATITPTQRILADTPTAQPEPSATAQPSPTALPTDLPTDLPTATLPPLPSVYHVTGITRVFQKWNDCGPANLTQALQFYGWSGNEDDARNAIKPNHEDRNVSPWELLRFVKDHTGVRAIARVAGDLQLIKRLVASKFAVLMETGYIVAGEGWAGHYLTVLGYDDNARILLGGDTNLGFGDDGLGQKEGYDDIDFRWHQFNRLYIVVYPIDREQELATILGPDADTRYNSEHALDVAKREAKAKPDDPFAWFNIGSSLTQLQRYTEATGFFDASRNTGTQLPWRILWYQFTPFEAYYRAGNFNEVLALAQVTLANAPIEEAQYWRGMVEAAKSQNDAAIKDFQAVLKFNPNFYFAADALARVQAGNFTPPDVKSSP